MRTRSRNCCLSDRAQVSMLQGGSPGGSQSTTALNVWSAVPCFLCFRVRAKGGTEGQGKEVEPTARPWHNRLEQQYVRRWLAARTFWHPETQIHDASQGRFPLLRCRLAIRWLFLNAEYCNLFLSGGQKVSSLGLALFFLSVAPYLRSASATALLDTTRFSAS